MVLLLPILLLFPGWALLPQQYPRRLQIPFILFASVGVTSLLGILLLIAGCFSVALIASIELLAGFLILITVRKVSPVSFRGAGIPGNLFLLALVIFIVTLGEPFDASGDAGVYSFSALHLAQTGSWDLSLTGMIPGDIPSDLLIRKTHYAYPWEEIAPGWVVQGNRVMPQFFPVYPLWGAIFSTVFGLYGTLAANLLGSFLLILSIYNLARLFMRGVFPFLTLVALLINPVFVLFLAYPSAEVFLAGLLSGWILWMIFFLRKPTLCGTILPGVLLGLALGVKFFAWSCLASMVLFLLFVSGDHRKRAWPVVFLPLPFVFLDTFLARAHVQNHLAQVLSLGSFSILLGIAFLLLILRLIWNRLKEVVPWIVIILLSIGAIYLALIRPMPIEVGGSNNIVELARLAGRTWFILVFLGLLWTLGRFRKAWQLFAPFLYVLVTLYVMWGSGDNPLYPFAARRFLPLTIPLSVFFFTFFLSRFRRIGPVFLSVCFFLALTPPWYVQHEALLTRQGQGYLNMLNQLSNLLPASSVTLATEQSWPYVSPLQLRDYPIFCLDLHHGEAMMKAQKVMAIRKSLGFLLSSPLGTGMVIEGSIDRIPPARTPPLKKGLSTPVKLEYAVISENQVQPSLSLDVGSDDFLRVAGCHLPEKDGDRTFRWTESQSSFLLKRGSSLTFLWSPGGNPENPLPVRVWCEGVLIGDFFVTGSWQESPPCHLPKGNGPVLVEVKTHSFQPALLDGGLDYRPLGIMVDSITVNSEEEPETGDR